MSFLDKVKIAADKLFHSETFYERDAKTPLKKNQFEIAVETKIPVVSEWTWGEASHLVFNNLNSCLGLIAINAEKTKLKGYHFSFCGSDEDYNYIIKGVIQSLKTEGYEIYSFGNSQKEWEKNFGVLCLKEYAVPALKDDENERNWLFSIEAGKIHADKWES